MTIKELEVQLDEAINKIDYLRGQLGKLKKANEYPRYNSIYFYIDVRGHIGRAYWTDTVVDKERFDIGNYFETKEDADFEVERLKVIAELKRYAEPKDRAWNGVNKHWYFYFIDDDLHYGYGQDAVRADIYFASDEDAEKAVETVGEDRVKKYYLGVEE